MEKYNPALPASTQRTYCMTLKGCRDYFIHVHIAQMLKHTNGYNLL